MAEGDPDKAKAEKLAAAKKKVEEMKKKAKKGGAIKKEGNIEASSQPTSKDEEPEPDGEPAEDKSTNEDKMEAREQANETSQDAEDAVSDLKTSTPHHDIPSSPMQSKMRSPSFRQSVGPISPNLGLSPEGDTAPKVYRKQAAKIEELEMENKRLAKESIEREKRWKKAENELEDLREAEGESVPKGIDTADGVASEELVKLRTEITALQRHNTQLQARPPHGSSPSVSTANAPSDLEAALLSKSSTIETMEIEISNLRAQLDRVSSGSSIEKEQIAALEEKLTRSERTATTAQRELGDLKKNLERTTEKAVKEGSERTSAETKVKTLERETEEAKRVAEEAQKKIEALEKKAAAMATLHKEHDARSQALRREREKVEKEADELRSRLVGVETENQSLKEAIERTTKREALGADDDGVEELENEERVILERRVRELEAELHDLRKGIYERQRRNIVDGADDNGKFTDVDLGSGYANGAGSRRNITAGGKGLGDFLASGLSAITGAGANNGADTRLLDDDGDIDFDEDAFRQAHEEEAKKTIARVKELKRALKTWEGWRLDLVEERRGGDEGIGEVFEV